MTKFEQAGAVPFWRRKRLEEMTEIEWDSLCDRCGRCCLTPLKDDATSIVYHSDLGCRLLDPATGGCCDYPSRKTLVPDCIQITPANIPKMDFLPPTCGYVRVHQGQDLEWWHPLVSGTFTSVAAAGMSAAGRFVDHRLAGIMEYHTVDWPGRSVSADTAANWNKAMFGGVNASVPTPFGRDGRVDLDLMAQHCFWLLSNGCNGLAVLDKAGEVASLAIAERIAILDGLLSRGVPVSKLLAGIGPASGPDCVRIASHAHEIGIRGVMLDISVPDKTLPRDVLSTAPIAAMPERIHLYLSFSAHPASAAACITALDAYNATMPGRLKGIRDEATGCDLANAALSRFGGYPFEVYVSDPSMLAAMTARGGAGLIGPGANLLGVQCAAIIRGAKPEQKVSLQRTIEATGRMLRSHPMIPGIKALLARHAGQAPWGRTRLPLRTLGRAERAALFKAFDALGIRLWPVEPIERPNPMVREALRLNASPPE